MSNYTMIGQGKCPPPFLQESLFPGTNGFVKGRFCSTILGTECCLPCPHAEWLYPDRFKTILGRVEWINVPGLLCLIFLIASFIFLPISKTHRHYLSLSLVISVAMMNVGFLIPLGANPSQCNDAITPNDMKSNIACAISGALVIGGGWFGVMWVCLITLALHLQICWHVVVGKLFMYAAISAGWVIPTVGIAVTLSLSGVSFRFGNTCHVKAENSLGSLWVPLIVVASITLIMQLATFIYCLKVYLASLVDDSSMSNTSAARSIISTRGVLTPKQAYHRIQRVIQLQWRGILIVLIIVIDVIYFAIVFVSQDRLESAIANGRDTALPWLTCLITSGGQKEACFSDTTNLRMSEAVVISVLILLSLNGFWCLILLGRTSMLTGWWELIQSNSEPDPVTVGSDVRVYKDPANYEMLANVSYPGKSPESLITPPKPAFYAAYTCSVRPDTGLSLDTEMTQQDQ